MSSLSSIKIRRTARQKLIKLQNMLRAKGLSDEQKAELKNQIDQCRVTINTIEVEVDKDEILRRREFLASNQGLQDIFNALWMIFYPHCTDNVLTKEGYTKFYQAISIALVGRHCFEDLTANIDKDWEYDQKIFGALNKENFFDFLFETIEVYSEIVNAGFYAAFSWALLDSIADTSLHPPKLRPLREIECITKMDSEAKVVAAYLRDKKIRARVAITAKSMARVPDVQLRLQGRRRARAIDDNQQKMVEAITHSLSHTKDADLNDEHEEEEAGVGAAVEALVDEEDDESVEEDEVKELSSPQRSFMSYIQKRKGSTMILNGSIGRDRAGSVLKMSGASGIDRGYAYEPPNATVPGSTAREPEPLSSRPTISKFAQFMQNRGREQARIEESSSRERSLSPLSGKNSAESSVSGDAGDGYQYQGGDMVAASGKKKKNKKSHVSTLADMHLEGKAVLSGDLAAAGMKVSRTGRGIVKGGVAGEDAPKQPDHIAAFFNNASAAATASSGAVDASPTTGGPADSKRLSSKGKGAFLAVNNSIPYFMMHYKPPLPDLSIGTAQEGDISRRKSSGSPKRRTMSQDEEKRREESGLGLSLSHVGELGMSDYNFLLSAARQNAKQRRLSSGFDSTIMEPEDVFDDAIRLQRARAQQSEIDDSASEAPTMGGVAASAEAYFLIPNVEKPGFHDPFSIGNVLAYKASLERKTIAQRHTQLVQAKTQAAAASETFAFTQSQSVDDDRFGSLLPVPSKKASLPPMLGRSSLLLSASHDDQSGSREAKVIRAVLNENVQHGGNQWVRPFTDDLSIGSSDHNSQLGKFSPKAGRRQSRQEAPTAEVAAALPFSDSSLSVPSDLLRITVIARSPPKPKSVSSEAVSSASRPLSRAAMSPKGAVQKKHHAAPSGRAADQAHNAIPQGLWTSTSTLAVSSSKSIGRTKSLQAPSISPVVHPCHESFLRVQGTLSSAEFQSQQKLARAGTLAGCNTAPWNARSSVEPFVSGRSDMIAGWRDKISVLRAPPLRPVNAMTSAGKHQDAVKQAFLSFVHKAQEAERIAARQERREQLLAQEQQQQQGESWIVVESGSDTLSGVAPASIDDSASAV